MDTFLKAAEACHKGGYPFGIGLGETSDNVDTAGAIFQSFGAELVDAKGNVTVKTDAVRQALEYYKKLMASCRRTCRPGTTRRTTNGWCRARAR